MYMPHIVIINTGNKIPLFDFSSKDQVDSLVSYSVKIHPLAGLYLAGFMNQHMESLVCMQHIC